MVGASTEQAAALTVLLERARALGADRESRPAQALSLYRDLSALLASAGPPPGGEGAAPALDDVRRAAIGALRWQALLLRARFVRRLLGAEAGEGPADLDDGAALLGAALVLHHPDDPDRPDTLYLRDFLTLTARLAAVDARVARAGAAEPLPGGATTPGLETSSRDAAPLAPSEAGNGTVGSSARPETAGWRSPGEMAPGETWAPRVEAAEVQGPAVPGSPGWRFGARGPRIPLTVVAVAVGCALGLASGLLLAPYLLDRLRGREPVGAPTTAPAASPVVRSPAAAPLPPEASPSAAEAVASGPAPPAPSAETDGASRATPGAPGARRAPAGAASPHTPSAATPGARTARRAPTGSGLRPSPRPTATPRRDAQPRAFARPAAGPLVTLVIRSDPPGAEVFVAGVRQGRTPLAIQRPVDRPVTLTVRLGKAVWSRSVRLSGEPVQVVTVRLPRAHPSPASRPTARPSAGGQANALTPGPAPSPSPPLRAPTAPAASPAGALSGTAAPATVAATPGSTPARFEHLMRQGLRLYQGGWYGPALARFRQATQVQPRSPRAWLWLGRAAFRAGRPGEARQALERVLALAPGSTYAREAEGVLRWMRGRTDGTP